MLDVHKTRLGVRTAVCHYHSRISVIGCDENGAPPPTSRTLPSEIPAKIDFLSFHSAQIGSNVRLPVRTCRCPPNIYAHFYQTLRSYLDLLLSFWHIAV